MRRTILISIFLISSLSLISSQKIELESEFLKQIIVKEKDSMIYVKESWGWEKMVEKLNRRKFHDYNLNNTIVLSDSEYDYIINEIKVNQNHIWNSNLFESSERINLNEIESYLKRKNQPVKLELEEKLKFNDTIAVIKLRNKNYFAYSFSKPIFFREGKFCIFSYNIITGEKLSNYRQVAFYKKTNRKWIEWLEIYNSLE